MMVRRKRKRTTRKRRKSRGEIRLKRKNIGGGERRLWNEKKREEER